MDKKKFDQIIETTINKCKSTLTRKGKEYTCNNSDRLANFKSAGLLSGMHPQQVLWGYVLKHLISVRDMINDIERYDSSIWQEKLGDIINYMLILMALVIEEEEADEEDEFIL